MKIIKLKYFVVIIVILLFSTFTVCNETPPQVPTSKSEDKIKLRCVMSSEDTTKLEAFKTFSTDMKTLFPDYDISFSFIKGNLQTYETKIKVLLSSDSIPDVFFSSDGEFANELFSANVVQPVDKYLNQLKFWDIVLPSAKVDGYNGHIYAVPFNDVYYQVIEINTDLFQQNNVKLPTTFSELQTAVSIFKSKGIVPIALGGKDGNAVYRMIEGFAYTVDPQITTKIVNGKGKFSDEPFKESAIKVKELLDMGAFEPNAKSVTDQDAANLFYSGKAAMYCTSSSDFKVSTQKLNEKCRLLYYPSISKARERNLGNALSGGVKKNSGLFVSQASKHPMEAVKLAVEMSKYYNRYLYEKQNNPAVIYIPSKLGWKAPQNAPLGLQQLMQDLSANRNIYPGLLQDKLPTAASKAILEDSSAFMTGLLSAEDYTKKMDNGLKLK